MRRVLATIVLLLLLAWVLPACTSDPKAGYAFSTQRAPGITTVEVPIFRNRTNAPGLEQQLTEAIIKEIIASTDLRVVQPTSTSTSLARADSVLAGAITKADLRTLSLREGTGLVQEVAVQLVVDFSWRKAGWGTAASSTSSGPATGTSDNVLVARRNFTAVDTFVPSRPTGERLELGESAAIQRMAKAIVSEMRSAW